MSSTLLIGVGISIVVITVVSAYVIHHMVEDRDNGGLLQFVVFMIGLNGSASLGFEYFPWYALGFFFEGGYRTTIFNYFLFKTDDAPQDFGGPTFLSYDVSTAFLSFGVKTTW